MDQKVFHMMSMSMSMNIHFNQKVMIWQTDCTFFFSFVSSSEIKQKKKWNRCWATCLWVKSTFWNYLETLYKVVSLVWFLWSKETAISWLMLRPIYIQNKSYTIRQFRIINELIKWKSQSPQNVRVSCSVACSIWESYF